MLALPFRHKEWERTVGAHGRLQPPALDVNAPDLYLPSMAYITYILVVGFVMGANGNPSPNPDPNPNPNPDPDPNPSPSPSPNPNPNPDPDPNPNPDPGPDQEMAAHNKRLECTPRISSEDATSCLQQCARVRVRVRVRNPNPNPNPNPNQA